MRSFTRTGRIERLHLHEHASRRCRLFEPRDLDQRRVAERVGEIFVDACHSTCLTPGLRRTFRGPFSGAAPDFRRGRKRAPGASISDHARTLVRGRAGRPHRTFARSARGAGPRRRAVARRRARRRIAVRTGRDAPAGHAGAVGGHHRPHAHRCASSRSDTPTAKRASRLRPRRALRSARSRSR